MKRNRTVRIKKVETNENDRSAAVEGENDGHDDNATRQGKDGKDRDSDHNRC